MLRTQFLIPAAYGVLALSSLIIPACWICDDDRALITACDRIREAVNQVEISCDLPPTSDVVICGAVCTDYGRCPDDETVAACTDAIRGLGCDAIPSRDAYASLDACVDIFADMVASCESSSGDFDDDD
jgi:hypothetical protein